MPNLKIDATKNNKGYKYSETKDSRNMDQSRNNSLIMLNTKENKSVSRSRPKLRQPKFVLDDEKTSSILKILEKNHR